MNAPLPLKVARDAAGAAPTRRSRAPATKWPACWRSGWPRRPRGEVLFSAADRGRYATDASIYQVMPVGVFVPRSERRRRDSRSTSPRPEGADRAARRPAPASAARRSAPALVIDHSQAPAQASCISTPNARTAEVEPGMVLDHLNPR